MAAFIDNRLNEDEKDRIWKHLDSCSSCYQIWLNITDLKEKSSLKLFYFIPKYVMPLAASILICIAAMQIFNYFTKPNLYELISSLYDSPLIQNDIANKKPQSLFNLPWEDSATIYGFNQKNQMSQSEKAFNAGLLSGKYLILKNDNYSIPDFLILDANVPSKKWVNSSWSIYFLLGKWCYITRAICLSNLIVNEDFWEKQQNIICHFKNQIQNIEDENNIIINDRLINIKTFLENDSLNTKERYWRFDNELETLINHFSINNM